MTALHASLYPEDLARLSVVCPACKRIFSLSNMKLIMSVRVQVSEVQSRLKPDL